jgi:hypothetical protein
VLNALRHQRTINQVKKYKEKQLASAQRLAASTNDQQLLTSPA